LAGFDGLFGERARAEETRGPEPLVEAHGVGGWVAHRILRGWHRDAGNADGHLTVADVDYRCWRDYSAASAFAAAFAAAFFALACADRSSLMRAFLPSRPRR